MDGKICSKCNTYRKLDDYYFRDKKAITICKICYKERNKNYYKSNKDKVDKINREYALNNRDKISQYIKEYQNKNRNKLRQYMREYQKKRLEHDIQFRIRRVFSKAIWYSLNGRKNKGRWENIVGYTTKELIDHLEKQFKPGMSWNNYGEWHIDHKRPVASFNFVSYDDQEFKECWSLSNLQPLWAQENLLKSFKWDLTAN